MLCEKLVVGDGSIFAIWLQTHSPHTTTEIFNRGRQNELTVAGTATASDQRPRLIVALTEAVDQPPRLIC
jgi:hypothetical protein